MVDYRMKDFLEFTKVALVEPDNRILNLENHTFYAYALNYDPNKHENKIIDNVLYNFKSKEKETHYIVDIFSNSILFKNRYFHKSPYIERIYMDSYDPNCKEELAFQMLTLYNLHYSNDDLIMILEIVDLLRENEKTYSKC